MLSPLTHAKQRGSNELAKAPGQLYNHAMLQEELKKGRRTATILISHLEQILFHLLTLLKLILHPYRGIGPFQSIKGCSKKGTRYYYPILHKDFFSRVHVKWCAFIDDLCLYGSMMN